jgi:trans-aconitate 2-methyltransferase
VHEWDATTYDRIADPQTRWGRAVVDRLIVHDGDRVLDAGCGSGRVTEIVLDRAPGVTVVALDNSLEMLSEARRRLSRFGDRVTFVRTDLARPLPLDDLVDAVLSTATFHWVRDHEALFTNLAAVMRPGAQLVAQCGGAGNIESVMAVLRDIGAPSDVVFATPEETRQRLIAAGFTDVETWLQPDPAEFESADAFRTFLRTVVLREHTAAMDAEDAETFVATVAAQLPAMTLDYVRLNIGAVRRSSAGAGVR